MKRVKIDILIKGIEVEEGFEESPECEVSDVLSFIVAELSGEGKELKDIDYLEIIKK